MSLRPLPLEAGAETDSPEGVEVDQRRLIDLPTANLICSVIDELTCSTDRRQFVAPIAGSGISHRARLRLRQRDELDVAGHAVEPGRLPVGLRLLDAVPARGHEIPPDDARSIHWLPAQH